MKKFLKHTHFLVTGGAGFIGSNLVEELLKNNYRVTVLDNLSTGKIENIKPFMNNSNFKFVKGDIRNLDVCLKACEDIDYLLHQAAIGSVSRSLEEPILYNDININGTLNIMYAAQNKKVKKVVYASSSSVYGDTETLPKIEGNEGQLLSPYSLTKKVDEMYALMFYKIYKLPTIGLRYFNVYGPKQNEKSIYSAVIPSFINKLINNEQVTINGDGESSRDFTYVSDVVKANINACLASSKCNGKIYNIAYGDQTTLNDLYYNIRALLKKELKPIYGPFRKGDIRHSKADISKAKKELDYRPTTNISLGLEKTVNWYLQNQIKP